MRSKLHENKIVGYWTLLSKRDKKWLCKCTCGTTKLVQSSSLTSEVSTSCGCKRKELLKLNNPMFRDDIKKKVAEKVSAAYTLDRIEQLKLISRRPDVIAKRKATNQLRYGGNAPAYSIAVRSKISNTNMNKYGTKVASQAQEVKDKAKQHFLDTYGVTNIMKLDKYKEMVSELVSKQRRDAGIETLPNGLLVVDECRLQGVRPTTYRNWRREFGPDVAQAKLYGDRLTFRSNLEMKAVELLKPLEEVGVSVEIWNKKAHADLPYKPDIKLSIGDKILYVDVDGLYWHSDANQDDNRYHLNKAAAFLGAGVNLLQFREDEIYNQPSIVFSMVENKLGMSSKRFGARELIVKDVKVSEAIQFLDDNHLMGSMLGTKSVGLYKGEELISVLSYRVEREKNLLDISRFCVKKSISVSGAFSKLLKLVEKTNPNVLTVQNFVDYRYSTGNSCIVNNFDLIGVTLGWRWTDGVSTFNRMYCMADSKNNITEAEKATRMGLNKIYDAGQAKFIKSVRREEEK